MKSVCVLVAFAAVAYAVAPAQKSAESESLEWVKPSHQRNHYGHKAYHSGKLYQKCTCICPTYHKVHSYGSQQQHSYAYKSMKTQAAQHKLEQQQQLESQLASEMEAKSGLEKMQSAGEAQAQAESTMRNHYHAYGHKPQQLHHKCTCICPSEYQHSSYEQPQSYGYKPPVAAVAAAVDSKRSQEIAKKADHN